MLGSLIGGAVGVGGSIFGGLSASKAMRKVRRNLQERKRENENWFNRRYNEDATQRADAQRVLEITADNIRSRNRAAASNAAVMGGTEESVASAQQSNAAALSDAASRIAVAGEARKDALERDYLAKRDAIDDSLNDLSVKKAQAVTDAIQGVADASGELGVSIDEALSNRKDA